MCADHVQLTRNLLMRAVESLQHTCTSRPRFVSTCASSSQSHTQSFQSERNRFLAWFQEGWWQERIWMTQEKACENLPDGKSRNLHLLSGLRGKALIISEWKSELLPNPSIVSCFIPKLALSNSPASSDVGGLVCVVFAKHMKSCVHILSTHMLLLGKFRFLLATTPLETKVKKPVSFT